MTDDIAIRLRGEGIRPGQVRSHELAEILIAAEDFVIAEALLRDPDLDREAVFIGLYDIQDRSLSLRFKPSIARVAIPAFLAASAHIADGQFDRLAPESIRPLRVLVDFAKRRNAYAEFRSGEQALPIAILDKQTVLPEPAKISGATEITAKTLRVGGKVPRAMLEMLDGEVIYCALPETLAVELGHHLYKLSTFTGVATWDTLTLALESFRIDAFAPFEDLRPTEVLRELRSHLGDWVDALPNVSEASASWRRGEDEYEDDDDELRDTEGGHE